MRIDIITLLPKLLESPFGDSILKRAIEKKLVEINVVNLRDYATDKHRTLDDAPFGGEAGMVMKVEPIALCIEKLKSQREYAEVIYMSPDGELLGQKLANRLSIAGNLIILCGHYKGVDERVRQHFITKEISVGNFVVSGGELPAALLCDAVIRLLPGVLHDETSALTDSFQDDLIAPPVYSRPAEFRGWKVPDVLLSGNPAEIEKWKQEESLKRTREKRPEL